MGQCAAFPSHDCLALQERAREFPGTWVQCKDITMTGNSWEVVAKLVHHQRFFELKRMPLQKCLANRLPPSKYVCISGWEGAALL